MDVRLFIKEKVTREHKKVWERAAVGRNEKLTFVTAFFAFKTCFLVFVAIFSLHCPQSREKCCFTDLFRSKLITSSHFMLYSFFCTKAKVKESEGVSERLSAGVRGSK